MSDEIELAKQGVETAQHLVPHAATGAGSALTTLLAILGLQRFVARRRGDAEEPSGDVMSKRLGDLEATAKDTGEKVAKVLELLAVLLDREKRLEEDRREAVQLRRDHDALRADVAALRAKVEALELLLRRENNGG